VEGFAGGFWVLAQLYIEVSATCMIHMCSLSLSGLLAADELHPSCVFMLPLPSSHLSNHLIFSLLLHGVNSLVPQRSVLDIRIREFILY